jgi:hypothetical protein
MIGRALAILLLGAPPTALAADPSQFHGCWTVKRAPVYALSATAGGASISFSGDPIRLLPERFQRMGHSRGLVRLLCDVKAGAFVGCSVSTETPADFGLGAAAMRTVATAIAPRVLEGRRVSVELSFYISDPGDPTGVPCGSGG